MCVFSFCLDSGLNKATLHLFGFPWCVKPHPLTCQKLLVKSDVFVLPQIPIFRRKSAALAQSYEYQFRSTDLVVFSMETSLSFKGFSISLKVPTPQPFHLAVSQLHFTGFRDTIKRCEHLTIRGFAAIVQFLRGCCFKRQDGIGDVFAELATFFG